MLRRIWQWFVQQFRRLFGTETHPQPLPGGDFGIGNRVQKPAPEMKPLSDAEYEHFFMQLLDGTNANWQQAEIARFFQVLSDRATKQQWLDWFTRFSQRLQASTTANHELGYRLVKLGEVGDGEICEAAKQLGDRLLEMNPVAGTKIPNPNDVEGWFERGGEKMDRDDYSEALAAFDEALKLDPNHYRAWINRGNALSELQRLEEAIAAYDRAIEIKPDAELAWSHRGDTLYDLERYEDAIASWDRSLEIDPNDAETWYHKALTLAIKLSRFEESLTCCQKSLELNREDPQIWFHQGLALAGLNRWEEAIAAWDNAIQLKPDLREAWINKGKALQKLGNYAEAIEANNRAIAIGTTSHFNTVDA